MSIPTAEGVSPHILVIPFPAGGHMIPLLDLTHKLAASYTHLTITIFTTPKNLNLLCPLLSSHPSINTLVLPFPQHPSIPPGTENPDTPNYFRLIIQALSGLQDPIITWFNSHPSPPQSIISDMFCGWTNRIASQLGIPRLVFSPSGALALATMYYLWSEMPKRTNDEDENEVVSYSKIPNSPNYPWWQVSLIYRSYVGEYPNSAHLKDEFVQNMASWGLVLNSFDELEDVYLDHLRKILRHNRVWAVGPLLPTPDAHNKLISGRGGPSSVQEEEIARWLDNREDAKVVYICFGSHFRLTENQTEQLALGLEKSGVHFVWVVYTNSVIPSGFEDRVTGRGLVIRGWAPQLLILSHRAVGAFLTHCGWNSALEAVATGVPMLVWPMGADQFVNATFLVEELKVAKTVCEGATRVPDSDELARELAESVGDEGKRRCPALGLRRAALEAIKEGGSSDRNLRSLVQQLVNLAPHLL